MVNGGFTVKCRNEGRVEVVEMEDHATVGDLRALAAEHFGLDP